MRFKYYLRGAGIGILVATVIMMFSIHVHGGLMTDEKALRRASELGMIPGAVEEMESESETESETKKDATPMQEDAQTAEQEISLQTQVEPEQISSEQDDSANDMVQIEVKRGEVCRQVAEDLAGKGLIEDAESFRKYMDKLGYDDKISIGVYEIPVGATEEEIAVILANNPNE